MPNHVQNIINVEGDKKRICEMFENIKNDEYGLGTIDFNKVIPMPESLNVKAGKRAEQNINKWGTQWNAYDCEENTDCFNNNYLRFQTAWATPHPVIKKLSKMYPELDFEHKWADEDLGSNCGRRNYRDGKCIEEYFPDTNKESFEFAVTVWKYNIAELGYKLNPEGTDYIRCDDLD